jgi:multidrug resistance efflux pump
MEAAQQQQIQAQAQMQAQQAAAAPAPAAAAPVVDDQMAQIERLATMHSQGLLTDEEFAAAKAKALGI